MDDAVVPQSVQTLVKQCLVACVFLANGEEPIGPDDVAEPSRRLNDILVRCSEAAPELVATDAFVLPIARLSAWLEREQWQRPLDEWSPPAPAPPPVAATTEEEEKEGQEGEEGQAALRSLAAHLVEKWSDVPEPLRWALGFLDGPPTTEASQLISHRFWSVYVGAAGGTESVGRGLQRIASPKFSKKMAKVFVQSDPAAYAASGGSSLSSSSSSSSSSSAPTFTGKTEEVMSIFGMSGGAKGGGSAADEGGKEEGGGRSAAAARRGLPSPLRALRHAQVAALVSAARAEAGEAGEEEEEEEEEEEAERVGWLLGAVLNSKAGGALGATEAEEAFLQSALQWAATHAKALEEPSTVTTALNYLCEMASIEGYDRFSCAGRTPKSVHEALEAYEQSTVTFEGDEMFEPNPCGIKGFFRTNATIPRGTKVYVPYDGNHVLGGPAGKQTEGKEEEEEEEEAAYDAAVASIAGLVDSVRNGPPTGSVPATVRILEIDSLKRLVFEGQMLGNCLEGRLHSQVKYVSRVRQRSSSYWSMTILREDGTLDYECLVEVWHLRRGNVIHQAEGPRPRTIPTPEAWYWLSAWCDEQNLDLSNWNCYS